METVSPQSVLTESTDRVLVIDDDEFVRETVLEMLELGGWRCSSASGVARALEMIRAEPFDLVITDMHMPGESGLDLIRHVQKIDDSIPVILITGFPSVDSAINAMKSGAIEFITKPFDFNSLTQLVNKALRERKLRREIKRLQADADKARVIEKLNRDLNDKVDELTRLYRISDAMTEIADSVEIFDMMVEIASEVTGAQRVSLMMLDRGRTALRIRSSKGVPEDIVSSARVAMGAGVAGQVAKSGTLIRASRHVQVHVPSNNHAGTNSSYASRSWLSSPLRISGQIFGVLNLTDKHDRSDFTPRDEQMVQALLDKAGAKLENQALYEGIYTNLIDTLNSLVTTIEARDPYTRQHSYRVTEYSLRIAEALAVSDEELEMIEFASLLHDIGKIGIHDAILNKDGGLTDAEFEEIKKHVTVGEKIVEPLGLTSVERAIIRNHHERFDGRGYPDGIAGEQIPFLVRIVTVADCFDAMTSTRPYRKALSREEALGEILRNSGNQFDPDIVEVAERLIRGDGMYARPQTR